MIRCRTCGITYKDEATICLRCLNPLQNTNNSTTITKKNSQFENSDAKSSIKNKIYESEIYDKKVEKKPIATATPPPPRVVTNISSKNELNDMVYSDSKNQNELNLSNQALTSLPDNLDTNLIGLNVSENNLKEIPGKIEKLNRLKFLWLYENEIAEIPSIISSLTNLETLDLRGNKLTEKNIDSIFELKNLQFLSLESNNIQVLSEKISNLTNLEILHLGENPIEVLPDIINLKNLKELSIHSTNLSILPDSILTLPNLKTLDIWKTKIRSDDWILLELKEAGVTINFGV